MHVYTKDYNKENVFVYDKKTKLYTAIKDTFIELKTDQEFSLRFDLYKDFRTDGGSVPTIFRWFMPGWKEDNILLNLGYCVHDYCYGSKCVSKEIADDILRGIIRDAGYNRLHASTVCWAVNNFAKSHYGKDELDNKNFGEMCICETN